MSPGGFVSLWEFRVPAAADAEFRGYYGPEGEWARLFRRTPGYVGTTLYCDGQHPGRYVTLDRWESEPAFREFRERFAAEYAVLDRRCETLTTEERYLGAFTEVP